MYDCHYDLFTYIYSNRNNIGEVKKYCNKIFKNNIKGGIFNLFYMSEKEMHDELGIEANQINIIQNLKEVNELIKENKLIPTGIEYIIGIEGLDYLENLEDIDTLHKLGVRSVNPVWNNHNKFATGVRPIKILNKKKGLTELGRKLIKKLIERRIAIDLSHSDEETFWDIIEECKKFKRLNPRILASHSNCKAICNVPRNLTDKQITAIAELNGLIGVVGVKQFCSDNKNSEFKNEYIKHINHIKQLLGKIDNIVISTDDMSYYKIDIEYYRTMNVFNQKVINREITKLLKENDYNDYEINKIKRGNFERYFMPKFP